MHPPGAGCRSSTAGQASRTQHARGRGEARPPRLPANAQSHVRPQRRGEDRGLPPQTACRKAAPAPAGLSGGDETCKLAFKGTEPQHARRNPARPELPAGFSPGLLCCRLGQQRPATRTRLQLDLGYRSTANTDCLQDFQRWPGSPLLPGDELSVYVPQTLDMHPKPLGARLLQGGWAASLERGRPQDASPEPTGCGARLLSPHLAPRFTQGLALVGFSLLMGARSRSHHLPSAARGCLSPACPAGRAQFPGGSLLLTEELPTCCAIPVAPPESDPSGL